MKKKLIAIIMALSMVAGTVTPVIAADSEFSDGSQELQEFESFENIEVIEQEGIFNDTEESQGFDKAVNLDSPQPYEKKVQVGDEVWATLKYEYQYDKEYLSSAVISGNGPMWNYLQDGKTLDNVHTNPFFENGNRDVSSITIENGVTNVSDYLLRELYNIKEVTLGNSVKRIGKSAFRDCRELTTISLPDEIEELGESSFDSCGNLVEVDIPDTVTKLGDSCFAFCSSLQTVKLPDGLAHIPNGIFEDCYNLENINIPDSVISIGNDAFLACVNLTQIEFSSNLQSIGECAFEVCSNIKNITIPKSVIRIGPVTFQQCDRLESVIFEDGCLLSIPADMFSECINLTNVTLPEGIYGIDGYAFRGCIRLQEITIPKSVSNIDETSFDDCENLTKIKGYSNTAAERYAQQKGIEFKSLGGGDPAPSKKIKVGDNVYAEIEGDTLTLSGSGSTYAYGTWEDWNGWLNDNNLLQSIKKVIIGEDITRIEDGFFSFFTGIENIVLPDTLEYIGEGIFHNCSNLQKIQFSSALEEIPMISISELPKLTSVFIPEGIEIIGKEAFMGCTSLSRIDLPDSIKEIEQSAFGGCGELKELIIPEGVISLGVCAFVGCDSLEKIVFPASLKEIPVLGQAMDDIELPKLNNVVIPDGITTLGDSAFYGCPNLEQIDLPSSIKYIGRTAFALTGITEFNWPEGINSISSGVFLQCYNLREFSVPESVTEIRDNAFQSCTSLEKISVPKSVTYFGNNVFSNCRKLNIYGYKDSAAERYADVNNIKFVTSDYKVVFKNNGRTVKTEYVLAGNNATPPSLEQKVGYTLSWDGDYTNIQEDMIINAVWTKNDSGTTPPYPEPSPVKYTVTFKDRGKVIKTEKVVSGESADMPYIQRYGYDLTWDKDFSKITSNITVNAVWTVIKPEKVTALTAEILPKSIRLTWNETEYTSYYLVYRKAENEKEYKQITKTTKILYTDKNAKAGTEYQYKVIAVRFIENQQFRGNESDIVSAKIGAPETGKIYSVGNLNYKVMNSKEVRVTSPAKPIADLTIPTSVSIGGKSFKVTSIDHKAFYKNSDIVNIKIGNNVNYVGQYSFYQCPNLESVKFGKNVKIISTCAFTQCPKLGNVVLPGKVNRLGAKVFYHCPKLKSLTIKSLNLEYVGKKGLAVDRSTVIKVPSEKYAAYKNLITKSVKFAATKIVKL